MNLGISLSENSFFTPSQEELLEELRECFSKYDMDQSGKILTTWAGEVLRACNQNPTQEDLNNALLLHQVGYEITFAEMMSIYKKFLKRPTPKRPEEIVTFLRQWDNEGDGTICPAILKQMLSRLGEKLTDDEIDLLFQDQIDIETGRIKYEEFVYKILQE